MSASADYLYELMPALYRERDEAEGYPLRALLRIIAEQASFVEADIRSLYENLFIETCQPWVIPYIGDLVSNDLLYDTSRLTGPYKANELFNDLSGKDLKPSIAARIRADVAKTIYYRRRKGTPPMLEELARDVTGWPSHAVEFFELLGWTQHPEHIRFQSRWTDVRSIERMERVNSAFDETSHTVDVRQPDQVSGWHNVPNIGFFLWRLRSYPLKKVPARAAAGSVWQFHFSPLGAPSPLFSRWRREGDEAGLATEFHVPAPIRRAFFYEDLQRYAGLPAPRPAFTDLYGLFSSISGASFTTREEASFFILIDDVPVSPEQIVCRRLDPWPASQPTGDKVAIDVRSGRIALGDLVISAAAAEPPEVDALYHYGFSADMGGGPYERQKWLIRPELAEFRFRVKEDPTVPPGSPPVTHTSLIDALTDWASLTVAQRRNTIIAILDSRTYSLPAFIELSNENFLAIEAANGERPLLQTEGSGLEIRVRPPVVANDPDRRAELTLNGVVIEGTVEIAGDMGRLRLLHATIVPGGSLGEADGKPNAIVPSIQVTGLVGADGNPINTQLRIEMAFAITGPVLMPEHSEGIWVLDSIIDGFLGVDQVADALTGPPATIERSTILGSVNVKLLEASETIFGGAVQATRTQEGCVRFSFVPPTSRTPRRYRCQPDFAVDTEIRKALKRNPLLPQSEKDKIRQFIEGYLKPSFTALLYGRPEYAQLHLGCRIEITTGAEDGSEMGAFCHLKQPQREGNLRIRLREYLPFGLEPGIIYVT